MKMTKVGFIEKVQKPAIEKWEGGLVAKDKINWFWMVGAEACSFCEVFQTSDCTGCPLDDLHHFRCSAEFNNIHGCVRKSETGAILHSSFIRTFTRNARKLLQRIKDVRYEDIQWDESDMDKCYELDKADAERRTAEAND